MELKYVDSSTGDFSLIHTANVNHFPDSCPICHYSISPYKTSAFKNDSKDIHRIESTFRCPRNGCQSLFIAYYEEEGVTNKWFLKDVKPKAISIKVFEEEITNISPEFSLIYNQAKEAEELGLHYLAGMGYRKGLEFLIKDYLINSLGKDKELIENKFLGRCIAEDVSDTNVKEIAKRAVWLGNDETHYVKKWIDKDINDLKSLIDITVFWITSDIKTKKIITEMNI
ncbi:hypothetical protein LAV79_22825 [Peribacillus butanolivorans]|uniref:hypothetical protein n=1 Tax=Peribacillus butanolivorans TaxID=421767 RepID=UPI0030C9BBEA